MHLETIQANLAHCWMAARLYARLEAVKKHNEYRLVISKVIADALIAHVVMTMSRIWDKGSNNKDCLSFPNLDRRVDLTLTDQQKDRLKRLATDKTITTTNAIRDSFVAHSLGKPKCKAGQPIPGSDIQDLIERCHSLLSDIHASHFGEEFGWGDFYEELQKWETLIADIEAD
ncbi:AbiU2 domain-containing protein [Roseovarius sp. E0-M6]|uniref:AbiU2 domain-containing protein n=1 Tax=Roseovarius sp. E0-M6 TaxID=3127118 RepID=UPI00301006A3